MSYLFEAKRVYNEFQKTDFKKLLGSISYDYDTVLSSIEKKFGFDVLRQSYSEDISNTVNTYLPFFKKDLQKFLQLKEVTYYGKNIPLRTLLLLMWIWEKELKISDHLLQKFVDSLFLGTFGYKMIDFSFDNIKLNSQLSLVGYYSIRLAENLLVDVFGHNNANDALTKYFYMYLKTELLEKRNRWKQCPFSWNKAEDLGNKGAPIYAIHETLFRYAGFDSVKIDELISALVYISAAIQLIDDLADAKEDLSNGIETLVMKDFYKTFGVKTDISDEKINFILNQERLKLIYKTGQELFDKARIMLEKHDEYIILLSAEMWNFNFTTIFRLS